MSVIEHLEALRRALMVSLIAWAIATVAAIFISGHVISYLVERAGITQAIYLQPGGAVLLQLKVAMYIGIVLASPVIIQQAWWFVSPGLHPRERRFVLPLVVATIAFFALGVAVAMFALPLYIHVLGSLAPKDVKYLPDVTELVSFVVIMVFVLGMLRIVTSKWLHRRRPYWFLALGVLANFLTPGVDPLTPMIMFIPLYLFYEGTALLLKLLGR